MMTVLMSHSLLSTVCAPKEGEVSLTLCLALLEIACVPRSSVAAVPSIAELMVPSFRANALAPTLMPSPSESASTTV